MAPREVARVTTQAPTAAGPATLHRTGRRRRPSGAPPPLPRKIGASGTGWAIAAVVLLVWAVLAVRVDWVGRVTDRADSWVLRQIADVRAGWLTDVADVVEGVGSWSAVAVGLPLIVAIMVFKRWRHLFTYVGAIFVVEIIGEWLYFDYARPRPFGVTTIGSWSGYSFPAPTVAITALVVIGVTYTLVVPGRARNIAKVAGAVFLAVFAAAELYLATYHPFDIAVGVTLAYAVLVNAFRFFTPNDVFPVSYGHGKTAHLDVTGARGDAIRQAVHDQLGLTVSEIKPVGLAGSGGSTPLRLRVEGEPETYLFGKLYAMSHVRADRWYKLGRTLLYGRLEDEAPFQGVQRLAEYEDYALRVMRDAGVRTATPYGLVELTPAREYMVVTEFFDHAREIGDAEVDDDVIDQALEVVRKLWDSGLAHRDIKPANLLVQDGEVIVIDVAFMQLRPSPWRQAVDLANMMLVLAVRSDAERVYNRALRFFTPDEIGEAFAAARGVASPTQLRTAMKRDGRDLVEQFRSLASQRRRISLQRWSPVRVALAVGVVLFVLLTIQTVAVLIQLYTPAESVDVEGARPSCGRSELMTLVAQTVPSAASLPCVAALPAGWSIGGVNVEDGRTDFSLDSDVGGDDAVKVALRPPGECGLQGATEVPSDEGGVRRFERIVALEPAFRATRYYRFTGGCVRYQFSFDAPSSRLLFDTDTALAFQPRRPLVREVRERTALSLCGYGASRCAGEGA
jgi:tRNA A-37 threonylcarbamoyl transferase component Bud32